MKKINFSESLNHKSIALLFIGTFLYINVVAQENKNPVFVTTTAKCIINKTTNLESLSAKFQQYELASLPAVELSEFLSRTENKSKPFILKTANEQFELQLEPAEMVGNKYKLFQNNGNGEELSYAIVERIFYKGFANGDKKNLVRLTVKDGLVSGFLQRNGEEFFIESLKSFDKSADKNDAIIYKTKDIIAIDDFKCGVTDREIFQNRIEEQQQAEKENNLGKCFGLKVILITDYAMYSFFNSDAQEMQNKLIAVLNNTQGAYSNFDFSADSTKDVGDDELRFQLIGFYISTCANCDILLPSEPVPGASLQLNVPKWVSTNFPAPLVPFTFYWTTKELRVRTIGTNTVKIAGIAYGSMNTCTPLRVPFVACHYRAGDGYLRQVAAHELGHILNCIHDDIVNPSVRDYIMYFSVNPNSQFFSTQDLFPNGFGMEPYSSKLRIKYTVRRLSNCVFPCDTVVCDDLMQNLKASNWNNSDSIKVSWEGSGSQFTVNVRSKTQFPTPLLFTATTTGKNIIIPNLQSCRFYTIEVTNACGYRAFISIGTTAISVNKPKIVHQRNSLHDVEVSLYDAVNFDKDSLRITVDHQTKYFQKTLLPAKIVLNDIFSDGARHRIDVYEGTTKDCKTTVFYQAPYYRSDAVVLTQQNFNQCGLDNGWKDSILRIIPNPPFTTYIPYWQYKPIFASGNSVIVPGTIDSSCMINFSNYDRTPDSCLGSISLVSPIINPNGFKNVLLSFDHKVSIHKRTPKQGYFEVQAFDGAIWKVLYRADTTRGLGILFFNSQSPATFWDTIPARKFISLDQFKNEDLRIRFVVDDSTVLPIPNGSLMYVGLDNIKIDAYPIIDNTEKYSLTIFPNPTRKELFIKSGYQSELPSSYRIVDMTGRLIESSRLNNGRIIVSKLSAAMYVIQFFDKYANLLETKKFVIH